MSGTSAFSVNVRLLQSGDAANLAQLFADTVHHVNRADYSPEQVEAWAPRSFDPQQWRERLSGLLTFVAERDEGLVGFAAFAPSGHFDLLYVHHRFQRLGVASALCHRVEQEAVARGIRRLFTEASITARPFFERAGFRLLGDQIVEYRGVCFRNYRMEKLS